MLHQAGARSSVATAILCTTREVYALFTETAGLLDRIVIARSTNLAARRMLFLPRRRTCRAPRRPNTGPIETRAQLQDSNSAECVDGLLQPPDRVTPSGAWL